MWKKMLILFVLLISTETELVCQQPSRIFSVAIGLLSYDAFTRYSLLDTTLLSWCYNGINDPDIFCDHVDDSSTIESFEILLEGIRSKRYPSAFRFNDVRMVCLVKYIDDSHVDTLCFSGTSMSLNGDAFHFDDVFLLRLAARFPEGHREAIEHYVKGYRKFIEP